MNNLTLMRVIDELQEQPVDHKDVFDPNTIRDLQLYCSEDTVVFDDDNLFPKYIVMQLRNKFVIKEHESVSKMFLITYRANDSQVMIHNDTYPYGNFGKPTNTVCVPIQECYSTDIQQNQKAHMVIFEHASLKNAVFMYGHGSNTINRLRGNLTREVDRDYSSLYPTPVYKYPSDFSIKYPDLDLSNIPLAHYHNLKVNRAVPMDINNAIVHPRLALHTITKHHSSLLIRRNLVIWVDE